MTKERILEYLARMPFVPPPKLRNAHAQTIAGTVIPRRFKAVAENSEPRYFDTAPGVRVLAHCSWQKERRGRPTLVILHGMEGSTESRYMLGTAEKALGAGFNAVRVNTRNCGGTEHLSSTLYHAGLTDDLRQIIDEFVERDGLGELYIAGFSLGGNVVLKLAGEHGSAAPGQVKGVIAVSPTIDLNASADAIEPSLEVAAQMPAHPLEKRPMRGRVAVQAGKHQAFQLALVCGHEQDLPPYIRKRRDLGYSDIEVTATSSRMIVTEPMSVSNLPIVA